MNKRKQNRRVFVLMGDGECNEGSVWEAAALASELGLVNLIAIVDENGFRNDGSNTMYSKGPVIADVWQSFGWNVLTIDGHNTEAIEQAYAAALDYQDGPSVIVAKTIKGKGISFMEANNDWHHNRITAKTLKNCADELGFGLNDA
jgi:transketolase